MVGAQLGLEAAERWLKLSPEERTTIGVIAPTRALRDEINTRIRESLIAEGAVSGPARRGGKLVPKGLTRAEMARASNYSTGSTRLSGWRSTGGRRWSFGRATGDVGRATIRARNSFGWRTARKSDWTKTIRNSATWTRPGGHGSLYSGHDGGLYRGCNALCQSEPDEQENLLCVHQRGVGPCRAGLRRCRETLRNQLERERPERESRRGKESPGRPRTRRSCASNHSRSGTPATWTALTASTKPSFRRTRDTGISMNVA